MSDTLGFDLNEVHKRHAELSPEFGFEKSMQMLNRLGAFRTKHLARINVDGAFDFAVNDLGYQLQRCGYSIAVSYACLAEGLSEFQHLNEGPSRYFPSRIDRLFFYYVDDSYSNLYSAWNVLANILALFWVPGSAERVYPTYISKLATRSDVPQVQIAKLSAYIKAEFLTEIAPVRNKVLHRESSRARYFIDHLRYLDNRDQLEEARLVRDSQPEILRGHYAQFLAGIDAAIELLQAAQ
ncbi:MAG TPA: hypothetical protein VN915_13755 [Elusimicrobiota bacterium]|nr:hypothetical protein [Elusimicrobiota bacterium]